MALNIESALRLVAKVKGVGDVKKLEKAFVGVEKAAQGAAKGFKSVISSKAFQGMAVAATAVATGIGLSAKAAIDFEDKMAGVLKVMEDMDTKGIKDLRKEILDLGSELPIAVNGIADIYEAAGQAGKARDQMRDFALDVGRVSVAFDLTAEEAGKAMVSMQNALGLSQNEVRKLFDAMNHLGDSTGASAAELTEFMKRASAMGKAAGFAGRETAAIGASMIEAGVETTIAATSFRRLVSALTSGATATDKQLSALRKLGFAQIDAKFNERQLTHEVERQADRRIEIAKNETDQVVKEVRRRYRDQSTIIGDQIDDESDLVMKKIRRQSQRRVDALRDRMMNEEGVNKEAIQRQIEMIEDQTNQEIKLAQRAARDRLTAQTDLLDDREEAELRALEKEFANKEKIINAQREKELESAKAHAEEMAAASATGLADRVQVDAMGELLGIFEALAALPKSQMISTITDLMGEQAVRGMIQIVGELDKFKENIALVGEEGNYTNSVLTEFQKRMETTKAQTQLAQNSINAFAIAIGADAAKAIGELAKALTPIIKGFTKMLTDTPGLTKAIIGLGVAFVGITTAVPIVAAIKVGLGALGLTFGAVAAIGAVWALKIGLAIAGVYLAVKGLINLFKRLQETWKWVTDSISKITKESLHAVFKGIAIAFDVLTLGMYSRIKRFVQGALSLIAKVRNAFGSAQQQNANSGGDTVTVSGYAKGGYVSGGAQMAVIGEAGSEYVVPSSKISGFISNYQAGLRGQAAIPSSGGGGMSSPNVNIKTGPVMQTSDGQVYVTVEDLEAALSAYTSQVFSNSRTAGGRRFQGIS